MKCRHHRNLAQYQLGALSAARTAQIQRHLADCPCCQRELAALQRTVDVLQPMRQAEAPPETWARVQARLTPRRQASQRARQWAPMFAAALVLIIIVSVLVPMLHHGSEQPGLPGSDIYADVQLAAAWDNPLADKAALGLVMLASDGDLTVEAID